MGYREREKRLAALEAHRTQTHEGIARAAEECERRLLHVAEHAEEPPGGWYEPSDEELTAFKASLADDVARMRAHLARASPRRRP